jgi:hypothetical protein
MILTATTVDFDSVSAGLGLQQMFQGPQQNPIWRDHRITCWPFIYSTVNFLPVTSRVLLPALIGSLA